jgi:hypothetical protein
MLSAALLTYLRFLFAHPAVCPSGHTARSPRPRRPAKPSPYFDRLQVPECFQLPPVLLVRLGRLLISVE